MSEPPKYRSADEPFDHEEWKAYMDRHIDKAVHDRLAALEKWIQQIDINPTESFTDRLKRCTYFRRLTERLDERLAALEEEQANDEGEKDRVDFLYGRLNDLETLYGRLTERVEKLDAHSKHQNFRLYHLERDPELEQGKKNT
jgi:hypothetical protein